MFQKFSVSQNVLVWGAAASLYFFYSTRVHPYLFPAPVSTSKASLYSEGELHEINKEKKRELEKKGYPPNERK